MKAGQTPHQVHRKTDSEEPKSEMTDGPRPAPVEVVASKETKSLLFKGCKTRHALMLT